MMSDVARREKKVTAALGVLGQYIDDLDMDVRLDRGLRPASLDLLDRMVLLGEYATILLEGYDPRQKSEQGTVPSYAQTPIFDSRAHDREMELVGQLYQALKSEYTLYGRMSDKTPEDLQRCTYLEQRIDELDEYMHCSEILDH